MNGNTPGNKDTQKSFVLDGYTIHDFDIAYDTDNLGLDVLIFKHLKIPSNHNIILMFLTDLEILTAMH